MASKKPTKTELTSRVIAFLLGVIGIFLGYADKIGDAPMLLKQYSNYWPLFVGGAVVAKQLLLLLGDIMDDGKQNGSYKL